MRPWRAARLNRGDNGASRVIVNRAAMYHHVCFTSPPYSCNITAVAYREESKSRGRGSDQGRRQRGAETTRGKNPVIAVVMMMAPGLELLASQCAAACEQVCKSNNSSGGGTGSFLCAAISELQGETSSAKARGSGVARR